MWSSFAWKIFSVFSKILLVSQRENGDYTSKPWASMPIAGTFIQYRTNTGDFLNCSNSDNCFSFLRMPFAARWAASCKKRTFISLGYYPPNYSWRIGTTFSTVQKQHARILTLENSKLLPFCCHKATLFLIVLDSKSRKFKIFSNFSHFHHCGWISSTTISKFETAWSLFTCRCIGLQSTQTIQNKAMKLRCKWP